METKDKDVGITKKPVDDELTYQSKHYAPRTDIFETEKELFVVLDMPGVSKEQVDIRVEKDLLEIRGNIDTKDQVSWTPLHAEFNVGNFYRKFAVSDKVSKDQIDARLENGVLTIKLPKAPDAKARTIAVK